MSGVSCRVFEFFERGADKYGYALEQLVAGVDVELAVLRDPSNRVPWVVWSSLCERFEILAGGPGRSLAAGRTIIDLDASKSMRAMGGALVNPDLVYVAVARWLGPYFFRPLEWRVDHLAPGHLLLEIEMPEPASPAFWRMAEGAFIALPKAFGAREAHVKVQIDGGHGRFEIRRDASTTLWSRTIARVRATFAAPALLEELSVMQADLRSALAESVSSQREMNRALSAVPDPVVLIRDGEPVWRNDAWLRLLGMEVPTEVLEAASTENSIASPTLTELRLGSDWTFEIVPAVVIVYEGEQARMVMLRDVTQARATGERLRVADRLASLGTLAASVGHEINNPLQVALGSVDLARRSIDQSGGNPVLHQNLEAAIDGIKRAADITSDLLAFGREGSVSDDVQVGAIIDTALRLAGNELRHIGTIKLDLQPRLPRIRGNAGSLIQVVVNLLINAAQAMRECADQEHCIEISASRELDQVRLQVQDTGPGIPPELLLRIREPFFTTKGQGGSGLGLAVCDRIMRDHGGTMEISNREGGGARFTLCLPVSANVASEGAMRPFAEDEPDPSWRVLLVDDEELIASLIRSQLAPCEVIACQNEADVEAVIDSGAQFDAVLLDVMLLDSNGVEIASRLPGELQSRVVFMTGGVFDGEVLSRLSEHDKPVLSKPFTRAQLLHVLSGVIDQQRA